MMKVTGVVDRAVGSEETFITIELTPLEAMMLRDACEAAHHANPMIDRMGQDIAGVIHDAFSNLLDRSARNTG